MIKEGEGRYQDWQKKVQSLSYVFRQEIETLVQVNKDMNYIDAIIHFCEKNSIDLESVPKLIPKPLKEKIKYEASELNFLKRSSRAKLPL